MSDLSDFDLGGASGRGSSRRRRRSGGGGAATLSRSEVRSMLRGINPEPAALGSDEALAAIGEGGKRAARMLAQIEASDAPDSVKREARALFEGDQATKEKDRGVGRLLGGLGNVVGDVLQALDKPKRAVVATLQEGAEQVSGNEDGSSWADNVFRKESYGFGDALDANPGLANLNLPYFLANTVAKGGEVAGGKDGEGAGAPLDWMDRQLEGKWGGRAAGLAGDVLFDPLTYLTFGAKSGAVVDDAGRLVATGSKVKPKEAARLLAAQGDEEAASAVLRALSTMGATGDELASAGLEGGMRFMGKQVLSHDLVRALGGRQIAAAKTRAAGGKGMAHLREVFGANGIDRTAMRAGAGTEPIDALRFLDSQRAGDLKGYRLSGVLGDRMNDLARETRKQKSDGKQLYAALIRGPESEEFQALDAATDGLVTKWRTFLEDARLTANDFAGKDFIARRENYVPRIPSEDAKGLLGQSTNDKARGGRSWFEREALKPGMEWRGRTLTDAEPVEDQLWRIAQEDFGDNAVQLFENDLLKIVPAYLRGLQSRVGDQVMLNRLKESGVIRQRPLAGGADDAVTALGEAAARDRMMERAVNRLKATEGSGGPGALADEIANLTGKRADLARRWGRALPDEVARRFGDADKAAAELGSLSTQFDGNGAAAEVLSRGFSSVRDDLELRVLIGEEAALAAPASRKAILQDAARLRREAMDVADGAERFTDPRSRYIAALEIQRLEMEALGLEKGFLNVPVDEGLRRLSDPEIQKALSDMLAAGLQSQYRMFGMSPGYKSAAEVGGQVGDEMPADMLARMLQAQEVAKSPGMLLRSVDAANRGFKTYALLSPGFHIRNMIGGLFNNMVAGLDPQNYGRFARSLKTAHNVAAGKITAESVKDQQGLRAIQEIIDSGLLDDLNRVADMADNPNVRRVRDIRRTPGAKRRLTDNIVTRSSRYAGDKVEDSLRGSLAFDRLIKGGSIEQAMDDVYLFHFNYNDLSKFEKDFMRRVVPFWTWTSRNLGHQVEFLLTNPKAYQRWNNVKDFLGPEPGEEGDVIPPYLRGPGTAPLDEDIPFLGGEFLQPGIPIEATDETLRALGRNPVAAIFQDSAPMVKVPLERQFEEQFFAGLPLSDEQQAVPESWEAIPGLLPALESQGIVQTDRYGKYTISAKDAYTVEQGLPTLGRIRRLFPSEKRYQERATTSWLSFLGVGSRTVQEQTKESEMYRRLEEITKVRDRAYEAGYTSVKPESGR